MAPPPAPRRTAADFTGAAPKRAAADFASAPRRTAADFTPKAPVPERAFAEAATIDSLAAYADRATEWLNAHSQDELRETFARAEGGAEETQVAAGLEREGAEEKLNAAYDGFGTLSGMLREQADVLRKQDPKRAAEVEERAAKLEEAYRANMDGSLTAGRVKAGVKGAALSTLNTVAGVLDTPHRVVTRRLTGKALDPTRADDAPDMSQNEWMRRLRDIEREDPSSAVGLGMRGIRALTFLPGAAIGGAAGLTGAGFDVLEGAKNLAPKALGGDGLSWDEAKKPSLQGIEEAALGGAESAQELAVMMATDPTTPLSFMAGGAGKNGARQIALLGGTLGKTPAEIAAAQQAVAKAMAGVPESAIAATSRLGRDGLPISMQGRTAKAMETLTEFAPGGPGFGVEDDFLRAFGAQGERFGKGGLGLEVPFTDKALHLGDLVGKVSPRAGLAVEAPLTRAGKALGVVDPAKTAVRSLQQQAAGTRDAVTQALDEESKMLMQSANAAGITGPKEWDELVRRTMDPDIEMVPLAPGAAPPAGAKVFNGKVAQPGAGYRPAASLSPEKQAFINQYKSFMDRNFTRLEQAGVLTKGDRAENAVSGIYVPRQYERMFGFADDINLGPSGGTSTAKAFKSREGDGGIGTPIGASYVRSDIPMPGVLDDVLPAMKSQIHGQSDLAKILPKYNRQAAHSIAKAEMVRALQQSGLARKTSDVSRSPHLWKDIGEDVAIPVKYAKMVDEVFNSKPITIANIMRSRGAGTTGPGRAALRVLDWASGVENYWKNITLNWRPGYHAMNMVNDTQYLVAMGVKNPLGALKRGRDALAGKGTIVRLKDGRKASTRALAKEAQKFGYGTGSIGRTEAIGLGVREQQKTLGRIAAGKSERSLLDKALDAPGRVGDKWTDTSHVAAYIERRIAGDTPGEAAAAVRVGMVDYQTASPTLQLLRFIMPFATFALRGPKTAVTHAAKSPRAVVGSQRAAEAFIGDPGEDHTEPRKQWAERGTNLPLRPGLEDKFSQWRRMWGGTDVPEGDQASVLIRDAFVDPLNMPAQFAAGNFTPALNSMNPWARQAFENVSGKDLLNGGDLNPTMAPMNPGTPAWAGAAAGGVAGLVASRSPLGLAGGALAGGALAAGDWAEADPNQKEHGWLARTWGTFLPPMTAPLLNMAAREGVGPLEGRGEMTAPLSQFSAQRPYDAQGTVPDNTEAAQVMSMLSGLGVHTDSPIDGLKNTVNSEQLRALGLDAEAIRKMLRQWEILQAQGR